MPIVADGGVSASVLVFARASGAESSALTRLRRLRALGASVLPASIAFSESRADRKREIGSIVSRGSRPRVRAFDLGEAGVVRMPAGGLGTSPSPSTLRSSRSPDRRVVRRWRPAGSSAGLACEPASPPLAVASASPRFRRPTWGYPPVTGAAAPVPRLRPAAPPAAKEDT